MNQTKKKAANNNDNQLVPSSAMITHVSHPVWDMSGDEFASYAAAVAVEDIAGKIREAIDQGSLFLRQSAVWYYVAGRWLAWVKQNKLYGKHGDWEEFCREECRISPSQARKYILFAERNTWAEIKSFGDERFDLERALGYSPEPDDTKQDGAGAEDQAETPESKVGGNDLTPETGQRLEKLMATPKGRPKMARRNGANDLIPTPPSVTLALLEREQFVGTIWEPACGTGDIAKLLPQPCHASDLNNYGYGESGVDFLASSTQVDNIITNPPFSSLIEFKRKALQLAQKKVAILMYCRQLGDEVEAKTPLKTVYVFDERIKFEGADIGWKMAWYVWDIGYDGPITVIRIGLHASITTCR